MRKNKIAFILCFVMILSCPVYLQAQEAAIDNTALTELLNENASVVYNTSTGDIAVQPYFIYTSAVDTSLVISNGIAIGACSVTGYQNQVIKVAAYMYLQKKKSNGDFENVTSWYKEKDASYMNMENTYSLTASGTYRIMMVLNVYNKPMQYEVIQTYSNEVTYTRP